MIQILNLREKKALTREEIEQILPRAKTDVNTVLQQVHEIISEVKTNGITALRKHAAKFDQVEGHHLKVTNEVIEAAYLDASADFKKALTEMIARVKKASKLQVPGDVLKEIIPGGSVSQRWFPVNRVGLYVPGGKAVYPSSVVMNVVSAQTAGVQNIAIASPVQKTSGSVHPTILAAAKMLNISEVYAIGGASAIAAFAYGVPELDLEPVDIVTGPGNIFVAAAKRAVQGVIGIDSEAGTTEILIIADKTASPENIAADLLSQAEHDEAAASILLTDSEELITKTQAELKKQIKKTVNKDRAQAALSGNQSALILTNNIEHAVSLSNIYAPEHLSIQTESPQLLLPQISNAGAIFLGDYTPVSLGDYLAGSNHVLPTGGTARFSAGLGAHTFLRPQQIVHYDKSALHESSAKLKILAEAEGLPAHAEAVNIRFKE